MDKNDREKRRYIKELIIMSLVLAIVGLTVAYATVSTTLNIAGISITRSKVASWSVGFDSTSVVKTSGTTEIVKEPTINGTNISYEVKLENVGDSVTIKAIVKNKGTIDAKLKSYDLFGLPSEYENNISYKVTDENGDFLANNTVLKGQNSDVNTQYMTVYITITYNNSIYEGEGYKSFNLGLGLNFVQN